MLVTGLHPDVGGVLAATTGEAVVVVAAVVAAATIGALVATVVTRRRRPPADGGLADARIAALWAGAGTRPAPTHEPAAADPTTSASVLALTVWRLPHDQVLGLVLDALRDLGLELVEVAGDRAVLTTDPASATGAEPATAVAWYTPAVAVDDSGHGLHVHVELSGPGGPGLADALRRRLVTSSPAGGPVALLQDPAVRARPGDPRR